MLQQTGVDVFAPRRENMLIVTFLQKIAEWFLGVPPAEPGQGIAWRYGQNFPWPPWVLLLFGLGAVAYVVWVYQRDAGHLSRWARGVLISLRMTAIALLLFILSEAVLSVERTGLPYLVLLLDNSGSMATEDAPAKSAGAPSPGNRPAGKAADPPTRLNLSKELLLKNDGEFLKSLLENHKLRLYTVAETESLLGKGDYLRPEEIDQLLPELRQLQPRGEQTRLGDALRRVLNGMRGTPPSAIVLISDGITTDGEKLAAAARYAKQKSVPLFTVAVGNSDPTRDVELHDVLVDEVAFVDDPITFAYKLTGHGFSGKKARVSLKKKDSPETLAARDVEVAADGRAVKLELTYTPKSVGEFDYVLEVDPLPKESNVKNNRESRHVSVRKEKIRVLLVDSVPRWEFRELKVLLEREKSVELKTVLQDADPEFAQEDLFALSHFPVKRDELFQYDVVILGDVNLAYLSGSVLDNLREFVNEKGGGLLMIAGPYHNPATYEGTPLETLLPVELAGMKVPPADALITESFRPELTIHGRKGSSIFRFSDNEAEGQSVWESLPGFFWYVETPITKPGATVFATHSLRTGSQGKLPIITMQRFGAGKVIFHASDETWRWRFRTGDLYFGRYWVQVIRYLSRSKLLGKDRTAELTVDRKDYKTGDTVEIRVRFVDEKLAPTANDGVTVIVERQGDVQRKVTLTRVPEAPAVFEGQLTQAAEGSYHAWVATPSFAEAPPAQNFKVESPARETRVLRTDVAEMSRAALLTQGKSYTLSEAPQLTADIPPGLPVPLDTDDPIRLWNHWLAVVLFAGLLCTEWLLRKRLRLV